MTTEAGYTIYLSAIDLARRRYLRSRENQLRDLLGRWVSELDPVLAMRQGDYEILGLMAAGHSKISVPAN